MAMKIDIAGTNLSASQMSELFRLAALPRSHINRVTFQMYLEGRNPFDFERNKYGHALVTFVGLDLTGEEELERLAALGYRIGSYAKSCFTSTSADGYDKNHRLVAGQSYRIALVPGNEIKFQSDRTTANLRRLGMERYGYGKPLAGNISRIRESVSDKQMEDMGCRYVVSLHDPIKDLDGESRVLHANSRGAGRRVDTCDDTPTNQWREGGLFAFPVIVS